MDSASRPLATDTAPVLSQPLRKPMRLARQVSLLEREIHERLSPCGLELLFQTADVLSEGQWDADDSEQYYGSTMITIDLARHQTIATEACDAASARRVTQLIESDNKARAVIRKIAEQEARRLAEKPLGSVAVEMKLRWQGTRVFVDVDVEATAK